MREDYRVLYDASLAWFPAWRFAAWGLVAGALGALLLARGRGRAARWIGTTLAIFGPAWTIVMGVGLYGEHARLRRALRSGDYSMVDGTVHDRAASDRSAWLVESGATAHWYEYSASSLTPGYHRAAPADAGLREGDAVRVFDVNGRIARVLVQR